MNNICVINDNKFKSIYISYNFTFVNNKDNVSKNALLSLILSKASKEYKSSKDIESYLDSLYGSNFDVNIEKIGDLYNIEFRIECVNRLFLPNNQDVLYSCIDFLNEIIYCPKIENGCFDREIFEREKLFLLEKIKTKKDDKLKYAVIKTEELLCKNEPFGQYIYGNLEDAKSVCLEELNMAYNELITKSSVNIIISGNLSGYDNIDKVIYTKFEDKIRSLNLYGDLNKNNIVDSDMKEVTENVKSNQSVITFGMRINDLKLNDFCVLNVYNSILGASQSSKLFQNFREKESLAYTVRSRYYRFKGIFVIYAGIERDNYIKAKESIIRQIENMKNNISDIELNSAKENLINDILEWNDSKISLAKLQYFNAITNRKDSINDLISRINNVTKQEIYDISRKINIELIYFLGGE